MRGATCGSPAAARRDWGEKGYVCEVILTVCIVSFPPLPPPPPPRPHLHLRLQRTRLVQYVHHLPPRVRLAQHARLGEEAVGGDERDAGDGGHPGYELGQPVGVGRLQHVGQEVHGGAHGVDVG